MHWNSLAEFLAMGGYALYVWGSFGITAAVIALEVWLLRRHRLQTLESLRQQLLSDKTTS
jgi:heme exporter protein D